MTTLPIHLVNSPAATTQQQLIEMALATCQSSATRRIYRIRLNQFIASGHPLTRAGVAIHIQHLRDTGRSTSVVLGALSAIRKLASEAKVRHLLEEAEYWEIQDLHGGKHYRTRVGQWLTVAQVQTLLNLPDRSNYWGLRDACLIALLVGCGLRRAELTALTWAHYQEREGRMCLVNLLGKGNKYRTVPVPTWAQVDVDAWHLASQLPPPAPTTPAESAHAARRRPSVELVTGGLGYDGLLDLVQRYALRLGVKLAPHDLRRTLAQMLRRAGAELEQIQFTLGHSSIVTTQVYLNASIELAPGIAAVDKLGLVPGGGK